jgi:hypothetical protein
MEVLAARIQVDQLKPVHRKAAWVTPVRVKPVRVKAEPDQTAWVRRVELHRVARGVHPWWGSRFFPAQGVAAKFLPCPRMLKP